MPQVFQVLRCYQCMVFQVHQVKKAMKWECKMCGEKQSRKRNYGIGSAKDCRGHVQKLNGIRGDKDQQCSSEDEYESPEVKELPKFKRRLKSKWSNYVEEEKGEVIEDGPSYLNDAEVVLDIPKRPRKKFASPLKPKYNQCNSCEPVEFNTASSTMSVLIKNVKSDNIMNTDLVNSSKAYSNEVFEYKSTKQMTVNNIPKKSAFVPPKVSTNSKWADYVEDVEHNCDENEISTDICNQENIWNESYKIHDNIYDCIGIDVHREPDSNTELRDCYTDIRDRNKTINIDTERSIPRKEDSKPTSIFTLCDDTDLDSVLDF